VTKKVLVVGDVIIDVFHYGKAIGISAETPTVVAEPTANNMLIGGAGLVKRHLEARNCSHDLLTIGRDGFLLIDGCHLLQDETVEGWSISQKTRYFVDGYKLLQFDKINKKTHNTSSRKSFLRMFKNLVTENEYEIVIAADNRHGVFDWKLAETLVAMQNDFNYDLYVDSQFSQNSPNHDWYMDCHTLFMNRKEWEYWAQGSTPEEMSKLWNCNLIMKDGSNGCSALINGFHYEIPGEPVDVKDTCGAGDAFLAAYVSSPFDGVEAKLIDANSYAAWSCTFEGTETPTDDEYTEWLVSRRLQ